MPVTIMGANLSKMNYVSNFSFDESDQYYSDDGIEFDLCLLSRLGVPMYTVLSDSEVDSS